MIPRVHWRRKFLEGTPLSAFASDAERGPLRVTVDYLDSTTLPQTLLRELGDDSRSGIDVFDAAAITNAPYTRVQEVLTNPRDILVTEVLDDSAPHIPGAHGFFGYRANVAALVELVGVTTAEAEQLVTTVAAAQSLGIDIIATEDPRLLQFFRWKNALDFSSALALCGLYLRQRDAIHLEAKDGREWHIRPHDARTLTVELLVPAVVDIEQASMTLNGLPLERPEWRLANSALTRLTRALKARDELHFRTQVGESKTISEDAGFYLDYFLVCAVGAFDALARLVRLAYELRLRDWQCAWHNEQFLASLDQNAPGLASEARKDSIQKPLDVVRLNRNLVHEVAPEPLVEVGQSGRDKFPLLVVGPSASRILTAADGHENWQAWGLKEAAPFPGAYLAPDLFVEKATSELFRIMDALTKLIDLERLPNPDAGKRRQSFPLRGIPFLLGEQAAQRLLLLAGVG